MVFHLLSQATRPSEHVVFGALVAAVAVSVAEVVVSADVVSVSVESAFCYKLVYYVVAKNLILFKVWLIYFLTCPLENAVLDYVLLT